MTEHHHHAPTSIPPSSPAGMVQCAVEEWKRQGAPPAVVRSIRTGHRVPFQRHLEPFDIPSPPPATPEERAARPVMFAKLVTAQVLILASPPPPSCSSNTQHPVHTRSVPVSATMGSKAATAAAPADEGNPAARHTTDSRTNPPPPTSRASPQRRRGKHRRAHQRPTHSQYVSPWRLEPKLEAGQPTGEFRFICDMRHLNDHVQERPFKYQQLTSIPGMAEPSDRATCCDLRNFFYSFPVSPRDQKYFTVRAPPTLPPHTDPSNPPYIPNALYAFTGLPMGYRLSPYVACKALRWIATWVRTRKGWIVTFVDDHLLGASPRRIRALTYQYRELLRALGFTIHPTKGWAVGKRRFVFLGIGVCLATRTWFAPPYKLSKLQQACERTLHHIHTHDLMALPRIIARLGGLAMSLILPSPTMPLYTRSLWDALRGVNWRSNKPVHTPLQLREDLKAISSLTQLWTTAPFARHRATATLYTDASIRGFGGWGTVEADPEMMTNVATAQLDERTNSRGTGRTVHTFRAR